MFQFLKSRKNQRSIEQCSKPATSSLYTGCLLGVPMSIYIYSIYTYIYNTHCIYIYIYMYLYVQFFSCGKPQLVSGAPAFSCWELRKVQCFNSFRAFLAWQRSDVGIFWWLVNVSWIAMFANIGIDMLLKYRFMLVNVSSWLVIFSN